MEVDYTFARTEGKQPVGEALVFGATKKNGDQDDKDVMTIRTTYPHQTLKIRSGDGTLVMDLWIVYVPLDAAQRTNRTLACFPSAGPASPLHWTWHGRF